MTFLKQGRAELVNQHSDGWRNDRKAATTVIGRKPGELCLMSLQDDRDSPAAAGQENGAETTRIPERRATAFAEACHSLESGSGVVSSRCPASKQSRSAGGGGRFNGAKNN
jgi:hypothetical protein